jgi:predicted nucleic acid-binding protein
MAELYLCGPVIMEQSHGAERMLLRTGSDRYQLVLADMVSREFRGRILEFDGEAPLLAGKLRATRESRGRPLSIPDAMIAAICLLHGATLATRNVRDFEGLDLVLVNPFEAGA